MLKVSEEGGGGEGEVSRKDGWRKEGYVRLRQRAGESSWLWLGAARAVKL